MKSLKKLLAHERCFTRVLFLDARVTKDVFLEKGIPFLECVTLKHNTSQYMHYWTTLMSLMETFGYLKNIQYSIL